MSIHLEWLKAGRAPRGTPGRRQAPRRLRLVAASLIAGLVLIQTGCQSGPFSNCGSCNPCGFFRRATSRVFNGSAGCCGSGALGGTAVDYGGSSTVVAPSTAAPFYSPGPAPGSVPSTVTDSPTIMEPAPTAKPGTTTTPSTSSSTGSGAGRTSYNSTQSAARTAVRIDSALPAGRTSISAPAKAPSRNTSSDATTIEDDNPLDHLPPLGLPGEVTRSEATSPAPSASRPEGNSGISTAFEAATASAASRVEDSISLSSVDLPPDAVAGAGPGKEIARFASVDPKLAGGSQPSTAGLSWLADKGYRTVLDLRESNEVSPTFIAEAASRGLRYVAFPVNLQRLDPGRLARFQFELASPEARPLFFFDSDGSRAGALWYIRRVTIDRVDPQIARREAEEIGLKDPAAWQSTTAYVERLEAAKAHPAPTRTGASNRPDPPAASSANLEEPVLGLAFDEVPATDPPAAPTAVMASKLQADRLNPTDSPLTGTAKTASDRPQAGRLTTVPVATREPLNWQPFAAMLLTGLSLPLAYWTRIAIPDAIARVRASLPGPGPRPRSLPDGSDA
jgi:protein tyrosine phosphatase (PTP) superfamily phosphohydrolase (DUF442 family)